MINTLAWRIAVRYLKGKRSGNAVPILSRISMIAIAVGSCAMIILLSVFNGFDFLVRDLYKAFYADIKISAINGKFFAPDATLYKTLGDVKGIQGYANVIEDNVLLKSDENQCVATVKGVENNYFNVNDIRKYVTDGSDSITEYENSVVPDTSIYPVQASAIVGSQLMGELGLAPDNPFSTMMMYYPDAGDNNTANLMSGYRSIKLRADGAFHIQDDFDSKYLLTSLIQVQELFNSKGKLSAIELKLDNVAESDNIKELLSEKLGKSYKVETRFEQNRTLYMVISTERWAFFAILTLVLFIASLNMIGALALLVMEKQKDMAILKAMGAERNTIRNIFIAEGVLWSLIGGGVGLILGTLICIGQQYFHFIQLPGAYIVDGFPIHISLTDYPIIIAIVILVGVVASWYPAQRSVRVEAPSLRSN
jgi:lipoprotein-releasing system permease protein